MKIARNDVPVFTHDASDAPGYICTLDKFLCVRKRGQGAENTSRATLQVNRQTATHQREERTIMLFGDSLHNRLDLGILEGTTQ